MSGMRRATISAWQRHADGGYGADRHGWSLRVKWHPESPNGSRGFSWEAEQGSNKLASDEIFEEIEVAMAQAEEHVSTDPATIVGDPRAAAPGDRHVHH
jgi:hypothetical protein